MEVYQEQYIGILMEYLKMVIHQILTKIVKYMNTTTDGASSKEYLQNLFDCLVRLTDVLGIIVDKEDEILAADIEALIEERQAARKAKNFARADEIRDELLAKGIKKAGRILAFPGKWLVKSMKKQRKRLKFHGKNGKM